MALAEKKNVTTPAVEADRRLLQFDTYEEYLDSILSAADLRNLQRLVIARTIAAFGYRQNGETLTKEEFYKRRAVIYDAVFPRARGHKLSSDGVEIQDQLALELSVREKANRFGILSTIIFVRLKTKEGSELSGYIDYEHRLVTDNWVSFFKRGKILKPRITDLGYYHWRHGTVRNNLSKNYIPTIDNRHGLLFLNRHDHKLVYPDPQRLDPGQNTTRLNVACSKYLQCELFDHVVRKKC